MGFTRAAKGGADAVLQFEGSEQPRRLRHALLASQPFGPDLDLPRLRQLQFRLLLHSTVYWLLHTIRCWLAQCHVPHLQLGTVHLRLLIIGGWVRPRLGAVYLHLARSHPGEPL